MIAGLEEITEGTIEIGPRVVNELEPRNRDIAMVFQDYALYPHLNVYDNLAFGLRRRGTRRDELDSRVREVARMLGIENLLQRRPSQLSGGQRQRVAMGRAIVRQPQAFLMDEPLSNLDAKFRVQMRAELLKLHQRIGTTTIYVTHDQVEAMTMGDRVAVLRDGKLQQLDTPRNLYSAPANLFVAGFIGSPGMNLIEAELETDDGSGLAVRFGKFRLQGLRDVAGVSSYRGRKVALGIRPEAFEDASFAPDGSLPRLTVEVEVVEEMGSDTLVTFAVGGVPVQTGDVQALLEDLDGDASAGGEAIFTARTSPKTSARPGAPLELAVDVEQLYLFDLSTGEALVTPHGAQLTLTGSAQ